MEALCGPRSRDYNIVLHLCATVSGEGWYEHGVLHFDEAPGPIAPNSVLYVVDSQLYIDALRAGRR